MPFPNKTQSSQKEKLPIPPKHVVPALTGMLANSEPLALLLQRAELDADFISPGDANRLQRTIGNQAVGRLGNEQGGGTVVSPSNYTLQQMLDSQSQLRDQWVVQRQPIHTVSPASSNPQVQRDIDPKVERALLAAAERDPEILRVSPINNILETIRGKGNDGKDVIPLKMQREITHLWSKNQKKKRGNDEELVTRLDYVRAYLIKRFMEEYIYNVMEGGQDVDRKAAKKAALDVVLRLKKELLGWGLAKAGAISPELNYLLTTLEAPMGEDTAVNVGPRIEIRGTTIPGGGFPGKWHSFLVYTNGFGDQFYIASHMAGQGDQEGLLQANVGEYRPGIHEWAPDADTKILEEGPSAEDKWPLLMAAANDINRAQLPYKMMSVNCNRAAFHILTAAGVASVKPPAPNYPGWGKMLF